MQTNLEIYNFVINNILLMGIFVLSLVRVIPPEWAGFWKYNNDREADGFAPKISLLRLVIHNLVDGIFAGVLINILSLFQFKQIITLIIFIAFGFDLLFRHQISGQAVTLTGIGIIVLYLDRLIETGKHIKLFGGLLEWDKDQPVKDDKIKKSSN